MFRNVRQNPLGNNSCYTLVVCKCVLGNPGSSLYSITPFGAKSYLLLTNPELNWDGEKLKACLEFRLKEATKDKTAQKLVPTTIFLMKKSKYCKTWIYSLF